MSYDSTAYLHEHLDKLLSQKNELLAVGAADPELAALAADEIAALDKEIASVETTIHDIEFPPVTEHEFRNCILELRAGAGGDEAKIWMNDLLLMYTKYAVAKNFKVEPVDEGVIEIRAKEAYNTFRFESGVHRVQRVPETEASGRIHTSTASVACIPEIPDTHVSIRDDELEWQFIRSGGHGGQNVNKVSTAVRLTHIPTGLVVTSSRERQQAQNREIALQLLRSKIWEMEEEKRLEEIGDARSVIGRAQRAEKIRTYNFPQNRMTDHRIPHSWYDLDRRLQGDLDDVVSTLQEWETNQKAGVESASNESETEQEDSE
jgi:peptide chain release factor 1